MLKKLWYGAVLAGVLLCLLLSSPALAHGGHGHRGRHHWRHHHKHVHHYRYLRYYHVPVHVRHYHRHYRPVVRGRIVLPAPLLPRLIFRIN